MGSAWVDRQGVTSDAVRLFLPSIPERVSGCESTCKGLGYHRSGGGGDDHTSGRAVLFRPALLHARYRDDRHHGALVALVERRARRDFCALPDDGAGHVPHVRAAFRTAGWTLAPLGGGYWTLATRPARAAACRG